MNKTLNKSRGQVAVLYAGAIAVLLGAVALGTDVAVMYVNWQQMQKTVDAAAIAGANYLTGTGNSFPTAAVAGGCAGDDAQKAACTYALANGLDASNLTPAPSEPTTNRILVTATNTNLPYLFGQALGMNNYAITTTAVAQVGPPGTLPTGMFPVGLQCTGPCDLSLLDPGQSVSFGSKFVGGLAPGNWDWLGPDGAGASTLGNTIQNGASGSWSIGDTISTAPGNKGNAGPVQSGLNARLRSCPALSPDPCSGGNPTNIPKDDPCLVTVPAVDYHGCTGNCSMVIEGFAEIYLEPTSTTAELDGCFVSSLTPKTVAGGPSTPALGPIAPPVLIQ
jgi:hypothetical protein